MLTQQQKIDTRYPFLDLISESQALARGIHLTDNSTYTLYHAIKKNSTIAKVNQNALFTISVGKGATASTGSTNIKHDTSSLLDLSTEGFFDASKEKIISIMSKMIQDKLAAQIFRLEYRDGSLNLIPCYIALNAAASPLSLYKAILRTSSVNVGAFLKTLPVLDVETIGLSYLDDLAGKKVTAKTHPNVLVDPFSVIQPDNFDIPPNEKLLALSRTELKEELFQSQELGEIPNYGLIPIHEESIINRFTAAEEVLKDSLLGVFQKKDESLKGIFNQLFLEESVYEMDPFSVNTTLFTEKFAKAIQNSSLKKSASLRTQQYPGALAVETILTFSKRAELLLKERSHEKNIKSYQSYKEKLFLAEHDQNLPITFIDETEKEKINIETWEYLINDSTIGHIRWELPDESIYTFVRIDAENIFEIVIEMGKEKSMPHWHALAVRTILDQYETELRSLFNTPDFLTPYGKMLRRVYLNYMPWYHQFLLFLRVDFFIDRAYRKAKFLIRKDQDYYSTKNTNRRKKYRQEQESVKKKSLESIGKLSLMNKIISQLDYFYFTKKHIPTAEEVRKGIGMELEDVERYMKFIKEENFQTIHSIKDSSSWGESILLYPRDADWAVRCARIKKTVEEVLEEESLLEKQFQQRCRRLLRFLQNDVRKRMTPDIKKEAPDPKNTEMSSEANNKMNSKNTGDAANTNNAGNSHENTKEENPMSDDSYTRLEEAVKRHELKQAASASQS